LGRDDVDNNQNEIYSERHFSRYCLLQNGHTGVDDIIIIIIIIITLIYYNYGSNGSTYGISQV